MEKLEGIIEKVLNYGKDLLDQEGISDISINEVVLLYDSDENIRGISADSVMESSKPKSIRCYYRLKDGRYQLICVPT